MSNQGKKILNMFAFIGIFLVAVALLLAQVLEWIGIQNWNIISAINTIGQCIAYIVTAIYAFFYVRSKRNLWWWLAYAIAVAVVVVVLIF